MRRPYPAEYDQIVPHPRRIEIGDAHCFDCDESYGPTYAVDIGYWELTLHRGHDVELVTWTEYVGEMGQRLIQGPKVP